MPNDSSTHVIHISAVDEDEMLETAIATSLKNGHFNEIVDALLSDAAIVIIGRTTPGLIPYNYRFKVKLFPLFNLNIEEELARFEDSLHEKQNPIRRMSNSRLIIIYKEFFTSR